MPCLWCDRKTKSRKPTQRLGGAGRWLCGVYSKAEPAHSWLLCSLHGVLCLLGLMLLLGLHFHPRAIPIFALPLPHTELGARGDPVHAQQVLSQAKWWCPSILGIIYGQNRIWPSFMSRTEPGQFLRLVSGCKSSVVSIGTFIFHFYKIRTSYLVGGSYCLGSLLLLNIST